MISKPKKKILRKRSIKVRNPDQSDIVTIYSITKTKLGNIREHIDYLLLEMFRHGILYDSIKSYDNEKYVTFYTKPPLTGNESHAYEKIIRALIELEGIEDTNR